MDIQFDGISSAHYQYQIFHCQAIYTTLVTKLEIASRIDAAASDKT